MPRHRPASRLILSTFLYLVYGCVISIVLSACFGLAGPPGGSNHATSPRWPQRLPPGWPAYPWQPTVPGAGFRADGATGMAFAWAALGRHCRVTRVLVFNQGNLRAYSSAEFRTGWPFKAALVRRFECLPRSSTPKPSSAREILEHGIRIGPARNPETIVGPSIPLAFNLPMLLANAIIFGGALKLGGLCWHSLRRTWREWEGLCEHCGYPRGNSDRCPECGTLSVSLRSRANRDRQP